MASAAAKIWFALAREAGVELPEILRRHQQRLREGLHLDRARIVRRGRSVDHLLRHRQAPGGKVLEGGDVFIHRRVEPVVGHDAGGKSQARASWLVILPPRSSASV